MASKAASKTAALAKAVPRDASKKRKHTGVPHDGVIHKLLKEQNLKLGRTNTIKPEAVLALSDLHAYLFERVMRQIAASHDEHKTLSMRAVEGAWAIMLPISSTPAQEKLSTHVHAGAGRALISYAQSIEQ